MTVKYPDLRRECIGYMRGLADPEYQERVWIKGIAPPNYVDSFGDTVGFFFDGCTLGEDVEGCIGEILEDASEAQAVREVMDGLHLLLKKYGKRLKDNEYMAKPEFAAIVQAARAACNTIRGASTETPPDRDIRTT